jgi:hypothetical protein
MSKPAINEALREFAIETLTKSLQDKRLRPNAVLYRAEDLGLVIRVPATPEHVANGARCELGQEVWVLCDRLKEEASNE